MITNIIIFFIIIIFIYLLTSVDGYYILYLLNYLWEDNDLTVFHNTDKDWCKNLRENYKEIRKEFIDYQKSFNIPIYGEITKEQDFLSNNQKSKWRAVILKIYGNETKLSEYFPITSEIIRKVPKCHLCMFSILEPNKKIQPHYGANKAILRYHLGLIVPEKKESCTINVNNITKFWEEGKDIFFDDTYLHSVHNNTEEQRVVLFLDVQKDFNNYIKNLFCNIIFIIGKFNSTVININKNVEINHFKLD